MYYLPRYACVAQLVEPRIHTPAGWWFEPTRRHQYRFLTYFHFLSQVVLGMTKTAH